MKKLFFLLTTLLLCNYSFVAAQTIGSDSRGKAVFNFYKSKSFSLPISAATSSVKVNYTALVGRGTQYYVGEPEINYENGEYSHSDSARLTVAKSTGLNFSFSTENILKNLTKVSTFHPTYSLSVGIGKNIDLFNNWENIKTLKLPLYTWNLNLYGSFDNLIIYDTTTKVQERIKPFSTGVIAAGTLFFPWLAKSFLIGISGSTTYEVGNNISTLKNFQKNSPSYVNSQVISLGDIIGKIGDLKDLNSFRGSLSLPVFPKAIKMFKDQNSGKYKDSLQLCIIPYYTFYGPVNSKLKHLVGIYLNVSQGQNLFARNSTIVSGFGVGIDWVALNGLSDASVFVAGTLDIHAIFAHDTPDKQKVKNL